MWTLRDHGNYPGLSFCTLPLSSLSLSRTPSLESLCPPHSQRCIYIYVYASVCKRRRGKCTWLRDSGNEKRATNGFSAALVRVHSDETMERGELDEKKEEEVTEKVTTGV